VGLLSDGQFGFHLRDSTASHLANVVGRVNRHFEKTSLAEVVFLDVVKVFETVWIQGLLDVLTTLQPLKLPDDSHHIFPPFTDV
jgi:hypothetical protein